MAKAFSATEKAAIKQKIMETALDLYHDKGVKTLSIAELTKRVGIAQGSFYNFWKDKESLVMDVICYRSAQKLTVIEKDFATSLDDPIKFLTDIIYDYAVDLKEKVETQQTYQDAFKIFYKKKNGKVNYVKALYIDFLTKLTTYWKKQNVIISADVQGLSNVFIGAFVMCFNAKQFDRDYFYELLRVYILNAVSKYIKKEATNDCKF